MGSKKIKIDLPEGNQIVTTIKHEKIPADKKPPPPPPPIIAIIVSVYLTLVFSFIFRSVLRIEVKPEFRFDVPASPSPGGQPPGPEPPDFYPDPPTINPDPPQVRPSPYCPDIKIPDCYK